MNKPIIIYHRDLDGFVAALCFYFIIGEEAEYKSIQYGEPAPDVTGRLTAILDFSFDRETTEKMYAASEGNLLVLDHHDSAEEQLRGLSYCIVNKNKSGALLAFEHVVQSLRSKAERKQDGITHPLIFRLERLVRHVDDRDRWVFAKAGTREIVARLRMFPMNFKLWKTMLIAQVDRLEEVMQEGAVICQYQDGIINNMVKWARTGKIDDHVCRIVNSPILISDIGSKLVEGNTIAVIWFQRQDGVFTYLLRSAENGPDVGAIAKNWGGGGHKHAAGFSVQMYPEDIIRFDETKQPDASGASNDRTDKITEA